MFNIFLLIACITSVVPMSSQADELDSLINIQSIRGGELAKGLFGVLNDNKLSKNETSDLRFLIAYMPLSDLAMVNGRDLAEDVKLARKAHEEFSWGEQVTDELYNHFVLPHRVSQEPYIHGWRKMFMDELEPRVVHLSMSEAALEVNHWCHEKVTFKQTDGIDQDPFTTIRSGYGRCEEEMIFTISALRSIGIPARQCYTPYWAHSDNNHAWVEVWADGKWHYIGACEPEPVLNQAWFTNGAGRAMMVVSTAYGDYRGNEPILKSYGRSTLINSTVVYGNPRELRVTLVDKKGRPMPEQRILFNLFIYACFNPAVALMTDKQGQCTITCGQGDWIISAGKDDYGVLSMVSKDINAVTLKFANTDMLTSLTSLDYAPPAPPPNAKTVEKDSLFHGRTKNEKEMREERLWTVWAQEAGIELGKDAPQRPDSTIVKPVAQYLGVDIKDLLELLESSRGNWGTIYRFLTGRYPTTQWWKPYNMEPDIIPPMERAPLVPMLEPQGMPLHPDVEMKTPYRLPFHNRSKSPVLAAKEKQTAIITNVLENNKAKARYYLLKSLTNKELRSASLQFLEHHFYYSSLGLPLSDESAMLFINSLDSTAANRYKESVVAPRIDYEPISKWRQPLVKWLFDNPDLTESKSDKKLIDWLRKNITVEDTPDRLGNAVPPHLTLQLGRGSKRDVERLYVGLCRVRGLPARFNPVTNRLEKWDDDTNSWQAVIVFADKSKSNSVKNGRLFVEAATGDSVTVKAQYFRDWAVSKWETDMADAVDLGYLKPYQDMNWPADLPEGLYCLTTGIRREDGSAPVKVTWFEIKAGKDSRVKLEFRDSSGRERNIYDVGGQE